MRGPNVLEILYKGIQNKIDREKVQEKEKIGMMRGGSQGLYLPDGSSAGNCPRAAHARMLGVNPPQEKDRLTKAHMFDSGHANEDSWADNLAAAWDGIILRESDIPVSWKVDEATGSGRPDIVLARESEGGYLLPDGRRVDLVVGIENKQVSSINTGLEVLYLGSKPKLDHAVQAGRYMKELGIPWQIHYTLPFVLPVPNWSFLKSKTPTKGEPHTENVDFGKDGGATKLQPTSICYELTWHGGRLYFRRIDSGDPGWHGTIITEEGLDDYWRLAMYQPDDGLAPKSIPMDVFGKKGYYNPCDYCNLQQTGCEKVANYEEWFSLMKKYM